MDIHYTNHVLDRVSQRLLERWLEECPDRTPGLVTWTLGNVQQALRAYPTLEIKPRTKISTPYGVFVLSPTHRGLIVITYMDNLVPSPNVGTRAERTCRVCTELVTECSCPADVRR